MNLVTGKQGSRYARVWGAEVFEEENEELGTKVALYPHYAHTNFILDRVE